MIAGSLLALGALCMVMGLLLSGARTARTWLAMNMVGTLATFVAATLVLVGGTDWEWIGDWRLGGEPVHLRLDAVSALFLVLVSVVGAMGAAYARDYWSDQQHPGSAPRGRRWWSALLLSMGLVLTASNGLHFLIAWECFAICGYFLIVLERHRRDVRRAGWLYLAASHVGTLALFAFFALLAARTGTWDLGPLRARSDLAPLFWLVLIGFGMKAGFFPLHVWLPSAHANAPSHVSAIMSGVAIKMGIYGIIRFSGWLPVPSVAGWVVMGIGAVSALLGIVFAFTQNDVKRLLAYCSVENIGVILVGVGGALLAASHGDAPWGQLALAGALLHVWNHGAFKSLLFFGAGSVLHATGTRDVSRLGGLWRAMPWTAGTFAIGAVAVAGLPPLNGFVSEWLVYLGLFDATSKPGPSAWIAAFCAVMLATAGAVTLASFIKAASMIFLGAPRTRPAATAHESGPWMRGPMVSMAAICVGIGLLPSLVWPAISRAAGGWNPAWMPDATPDALRTVGRAQAFMGVLIVIAAVSLWRRVRVNGARRTVTWDCAFSAPTARMQYTGGSFAAIATGWFDWILVRRENARRPRGMLPETVLRVQRFPDMVLERLVIPTAKFITHFATSARRLQHGGLQSYVLYVLAGLVAMGSLVLMGSNA